MFNPIPVRLTADYFLSSGKNVLSRHKSKEDGNCRAWMCEAVLLFARGGLVLKYDQVQCDIFSGILACHAYYLLLRRNIIVSQRNTFVS